MERYMMHFVAPSARSRRPAARRFSVNRNVAIAAGVLALHVTGLWAMQNGLLQRAAAAVISVTVVAEMVEAPQSPAMQRLPAAKPKPITPQAPPVSAEPSPAPIAPPAEAAPQVPAPAVVAIAPAQATVVPDSSADTVQQPTSDAGYLRNPKPPYPAMSKRLGEHGRVTVRVYVGADGLPQKSELKQSSGFDRLDRVALETVMNWRFVPGQRSGTALAMWALVPFNFVLE
jgi:periplasmic protein TonB